MKSNEELIQLYIETNNEEYFNELYANNTGIMNKIINKFAFSKNIEMDDIVSSVDLGFYKAVKTYDKNKNNKFHMYACNIMTKEVLKCIEYSGAKCRDSSPFKFLNLDGKVGGDNIRDGTAYDYIDLGMFDVLRINNIEYLLDSINKGMDTVDNVYKEHIIPILLKETSSYKVAETLGVSPSTIQRVVNKFKYNVREYFYYKHEGDIVQYGIS